MTHADFRELLKARITKMQDTLDLKAMEYANDADRLHNFKASMQFSGRVPAANCWGFLVKHLTSIADMVEHLDQRGVHSTGAVIDEKIGDAINYLVLLEACLKEKP